jgi:hypothetical protein
MRIAENNKNAFIVGDGYFDELPQSSQDIVHELIEDAFNSINQEFLVEGEIEAFVA